MGVPVVPRSPPCGDGAASASSETASVDPLSGRMEVVDADADPDAPSAMHVRSPLRALRHGLPTALHQQEIERRVDEPEATVEGQRSFVVGTGVDDDLRHAAGATPTKRIDDKGRSESPARVGRVDRDALEIAPRSGSTGDREPGEVPVSCRVAGCGDDAQPRSRRRIECGEKIETVEAVIDAEGQTIDVDACADPRPPGATRRDGRSGKFAQALEIMGEETKHRDDLEAALLVTRCLGAGDGRRTEDVGRMWLVQPQRLRDGTRGERLGGV